MGKVTLNNAMLLWNRGENGGDAKMVDHPGSFRFPEFGMSACACYSIWNNLTEDERVTNILAEALAAIVRDGANGRAVVKAIMTVPEVRDVLAEDILN